MTEEEMIYKKDISLYTDVYCYKCKRLIALSNTLEFDGRRYCPKCSGEEYEKSQNVSPQR